MKRPAKIQLTLLAVAIFVKLHENNSKISSKCYVNDRLTLR